MSISVSQIANSQQFTTWLTRTNQLITLISSNVITLDSSTLGSLSSGNAQVNGNFYSANLMVGLGLYGGISGTTANLNIYTNTVFTFSATPYLELFANSTAANVNFIVNTVNFGVANLQGNVGFTGNVTFNANVTMGALSNLKVGGNLTINSSVLTIGNSTVNVVINSSFSGIQGLANLNLGNTTVNSVINSTVLTISTINSLANSVTSVNSSFIAIGNSTVNVSINSTVFSGSSNNASFFGGFPVSHFGTAGGGAFDPSVYAGISNATTLTSGSNTQTNTAIYAWSGANTALVVMGNSGPGAQVFSNANVALTVQSNHGNPFIVQNATSIFLEVYANGLALHSTALQANQTLTISSGGLVNTFTGNGNNLGTAYGLPTPGTALFGWNYSNVAGELDLIISGNPANGGLSIYNFTANILTNMFSVNTTSLTAQGLSVNSTSISVNGGLSVNIGSNSSLNSSSLFLGNGTQNYLITSGMMQVANLNGNISVTPLSTYILGGIAGGNVTMNATSLMIGNTLSNTLLTQGGLSILGGFPGIPIGNVTLNATALFIGNSTVNTFINSSSYGLGNSTVFSVGNSVADQWVGAVSTVTVNNIQVSIGSNVIANTTSMVVGNSTVNAVHTNSGLTVLGGFTTGNLSTNTTALFIGNSTVSSVVNSTTFTGTANNATNLGGLGSASYALVGGQAFTGAVNVGANVVLTTTQIMVGNSTVNTFLTNSGLYILGGVTLGNLTLNSSSLFIGNSTVSLSINSTVFTGAANNTLNLGGNPASFYANIAIPNFTTSVNVGANVFMNTSTFSIGNSTVNTNLTSNVLTLFGGIALGNVSLNSTALFLGNSTGSLSINSTSLATGNSTLNQNQLSLGNSTVNTIINSTSVSFSGTVLNADMPTSVAQFIYAGGGQTLAVNTYGWLFIPFPCTIKAATVLADQSGNVTFDIWTTPFSTWNLSAMSTLNSICSAAKPVLSSTNKYSNTTLTGWTTVVPANTVIVFTVNTAATSATLATLALTLLKT